MTWIQTRSGLAFDLLDPKPEQINLADIAWSLGRLARYTGHGLRHCSVAEHSVRCSDIAERKWNQSVAWDCLMHDAHEAYTGDVSRPLKEAIKRVYRRGRDGGASAFYPPDPLAWIEAMCAGVVAKRFNYNLAASSVREADGADLAAEMSLNLKLPPPRAWVFDVEGLAHKTLREDPGLWEEMPGSMTHRLASQAFLTRVVELAPDTETVAEAHEAKLWVDKWFAESLEEVRLGAVPAP